MSNAPKPPNSDTPPVKVTASTEPGKPTVVVINNSAAQKTPAPAPAAPSAPTVVVINPADKGAAPAQIAADPSAPTVVVIKADNPPADVPPAKTTKTIVVETTEIGSVGDPGLPPRDADGNFIRKNDYLLPRDEFGNIITVKKEIKVEQESKDEKKGAANDVILVIPPSGVAPTPPPAPAPRALP